mgnify:CR=1 FL=1
MKGRTKFILGLIVGLFLVYKASTGIESDSPYAYIVSGLVLVAFNGRMIYGLITGK